MHQIEILVDLFQLEHMRNHRIDLDLSVHVPVNDLGHVGTTARAAEGCAFPDATCDELEWPGRDLFSGLRDANDNGDTPAAVAGFKRLAHNRGIAGAIEGVIGAAIGQPHQMLNNVAIDLLRIDEMGHAEAAAPILPCRH